MMNAHQQQKRNPVSNGTPSEGTPPVQVEAKVSYVPMILATALTTTVAVGVTFFLTRYFESKKEEKELEKERQREEQASMNPSLPMMWPGMSGQASTQSNAEEVSKIDAIADRLNGWEENLQRREQALGAKQHNLSLVMGGED